MASIQFKSIDTVLEAYERRKVPAWSLWQGSQFMFKYEGDDLEQGASELQTILEALRESTNAIYTLKVYEDVPGGRIKDKTPHDGSFNFKLNADSQEISQQQYGSLRKYDKLEQEMQEIKQLLLAREEEEEPQNRLGIIGEILNDPGTSSIVVPLIMKAFGLGNLPPQQMPMRINGIEQDEQQTLSEALRILKANDPKLAEHLMKLAKLSNESPDSFKFLLTTLDGM